MPSFRIASHISLGSQKKGIPLNIPPKLTDFSQYGSTFSQCHLTHRLWKTCPSQMATARPSRRRTILPTQGKGKPNNLFILVSLTFLQHVFTDADLSDSKILGRAEEVLTLLDEFITEHDLHLPESWDLVIDLFYDGEEILATYYYVDHQARCIFFLDEFLVENLSGARELVTINTYQHFRKPL
jgi:hypothetical protein